MASGKYVMKCHYDVLQVDRANATADDIKKAYRKVCYSYHAYICTHIHAFFCVCCMIHSIYNCN